MPAVKVYAQALDPQQKAVIAKMFCDEVQKYLEVPVVEVIFLNIDRVYGNDEREHCLLEIEGPAKDADIIERIGQSVCNIFLEESGRTQCNVSAIYHINSQDLVVTPEGSLAKSLERRKNG